MKKIIMLPLFALAGCGPVDNSKVHFFITDNEIRAIADNAARNQISNYVALCANMTPSPGVIDPNCPLTVADFKYLSAEISNLESKLNQSGYIRPLYRPSDESESKRRQDDEGDDDGD